jgi:hypothetical protein
MKHGHDRTLPFLEPARCFRHLILRQRAPTLTMACHSARRQSTSHCASAPLIIEPRVRSSRPLNDPRRFGSQFPEGRRVIDGAFDALLPHPNGVQSTSGCREGGGPSAQLTTCLRATALCKVGGLAITGTTSPSCVEARANQHFPLKIQRGYRGPDHHSFVSPHLRYLSASIFFR